MKSWVYIALLFVVIALAVSPILLFPEAEFEGADGMAEDLIGEINPSYERWIEPFWEPPSGEIESMLFAMQAAAGSAFIGFYLGRITYRKKP